MAIKAGLVGVNPKGVDKNGMPIGSGGGSADAYTKAETDTLLNGKVSNSQLTANSKNFFFAYDETSQKYGYKLDGTGDFIPFETAAPGLNLPDKVTTGLIFPGNLKFEEGGYQIIDGICYFDIMLKNTGGTVSSGTIIQNAPKCENGGGSTCIAFVGESKTALNDFSANKITVSKDGSTDFTISGSSVYADWYVRFIAIYKKED